MSRLRSSLAMLLAAAALTAGCTSDDEPGDGTTTTSPPTGTTTATPPPGGNTTPPPGPAPQPVTDAGSIAGPFEKSWTITVPRLSPRAVTVNFNLTGAQAGAPPTAKVYLEFASPDGAVLKSTSVGLGGSGDSVAWSFTAADIAVTGDYVLRASASPPAAGAPGLPSGGVANYELYALVEY